MILRILRVCNKIKSFAKSRDANILAVFLRSLYLYFHRNVNLDDQLFHQSLDPNMPLAEAANFVGNKEFALFQRKINANQTQCLGDKTLFAQLAKSHDFPHPETFLFFEHSEDSNLSHGLTCNNEVITTRTEWLTYLADNLPERFVIKSSHGRCAQGIEVFTRSPNGTYRGQSYQHTIEMIYEKVVNEKAFGKCIFQSYLTCHPAIVNLTGSSAVQTVRLLTAKNPLGEVSPYCAFLKVVGQPDALVDNFKGGRGGNMMASINLDTGCIQDATGFNRDNFTHTQAVVHPVSQKTLVGFQIPSWNKVLEVSMALHTKLSGVRVVGWDIALTPDGPVILEGNPESGDMSPSRPWMTRDDLEYLKQLLHTPKKHRFSTLETPNPARASSGGQS